MPKQSSYDVVIIIPTLPKQPNLQWVDTIIQLIKQSPPKDLSWNIYLAYEGRDWNEAVNTAFERVKNCVNKGFILLDDDSFPLPNWADKLANYIQEYPSSLLQFCLIDKKGFFNQYYFSQVDKCSRTFNKLIRKSTAYKDPRELYGYTMVTKAAYYKNLKEPVKSAFAGFSGVFIPKIIYETVGQVAIANNIIYNEDVDFSFRALEKGFSSFIIPQYVLHLCGSTKLKKSIEYTNKVNSSDKWFYEKWFTNNQFINKLRQRGFIKRLVFRFLWTSSTRFFKHRVNKHRFAHNFAERLEVML
jgi:GT2 family glycosyltransferase